MSPDDLPSGTWAAEHSASTVWFTARKLGMFRVRGNLPITRLEVDVASGTPVRIEATLDARSVDTGIERRDNALRGRHFLGASTAPLIRFAAETIRSTDGAWEIAGWLRVKDVRSPVSLRAEVRAADQRGARVHATARVDRRLIGIGRGPRWLIGRWLEVSVDADLLVVEAASRRRHATPRTRAQQ